MVRIFLVEDDDSHAELLLRCLKHFEFPYQVDRARDGSEALAYLKSEQRPTPDVILLDLKLPKVGGHEILRFIREDPRLQEIPVIVLTTSDAERDRQTAYELKASSYLVKPLEFADLKRLVHDLTVFWVRRSNP